MEAFVVYMYRNTMLPRRSPSTLPSMHGLLATDTDQPNSSASIQLKRAQRANENGAGANRNTAEH